MVRVNPVGEVWNVGNVASDHDRRPRLVLPYQVAHCFHFRLIGNDARYAYDVVLSLTEFLDETVSRREVEHGAGGGDIRLNEHDPPTPMKHPQGKRPLHGDSSLISTSVRMVHSQRTSNEKRPGRGRRGS